MAAHQNEVFINQERRLRNITELVVQNCTIEHPFICSLGIDTMYGRFVSVSYSEYTLRKVYYKHMKL